MGIAGPASAFMLVTGLFAAFPATSGAAFNYFDPDSLNQVPATLSATGFYDNIATKRVTARAVPFEVNSPQWSDAAGKKRWVLLKQGKSIGYQDTTDYYTYPDSTVFIQEIHHDTVPGDTATRLRWETRLLILKKDTAAKLDKWHGFGYRWNRQGTEARLVDFFENERAVLRYYPNGRNQPAQLKKWYFPSSGSCNFCHVNGGGQIQGRGVLGFFTAQLNKIVNDTNQLTRLFDAGVFANITPRPDFSRSPRWAGLKEASASLDLRARSYLAANCSGCHGDRGNRNLASGHGSKVNFDYFDMKKPEELGMAREGALEYQPTSQGNPATADSNFIVHPKHPHLSSIIWRLQAENEVAPPVDTIQWVFSDAFDIPVAVMPPLGRFQADSSALKVLTDWINSLPEDPAMGVVHGIRAKSSRLWIAGNLIHVEGLKDIPARAWLVDTRGMRRAVIAVGPGRYRLPEDAAPGVYHLLLGADRSYRLMLP
jgi:hypothetical protein